MSYYTTIPIFAQLLKELEPVFNSEVILTEEASMRMIEIEEGVYKMGPYWSFIDEESGEVVWAFDYAKYCENEDIKGDGLLKFREYVVELLDNCESCNV